MVLATSGVGSIGFRIVLLLHILSVIIAFAPTFVHPILGAQTKRDGKSSWQNATRHMSKNGQRMYAPALILAGLFGIGLIGLSNSTYSFSDAWVSGAFVVWFAMNGVLHGVLLPAEKRVAAGETSSQQKMDLGGGAMSILLIVMLVLIIWKP